MKDRDYSKNHSNSYSNSHSNSRKARAYGAHIRLVGRRWVYR